MARRYYNGKLGKFKYDNAEFKLMDGCLRYIGAETDGSKIKIPEGITDCSYMFHGCSSLAEAPVIPAGVTDCYCMFYNCSSLLKAPVIPVGAKDCHSMFSWCVSLVEAPEIPAGVTECGGMFYGCSSLIEAPTIPESISDCDCMFYGCSSLKNYSLDNATYRKEIYCSCPPIIKEIDSFTQKFKERKQLNA